MTRNLTVEMLNLVCLPRNTIGLQQTGCDIINCSIVASTLFLLSLRAGVGCVSGKGSQHICAMRANRKRCRQPRPSTRPL